MLPASAGKVKTPFFTSDHIDGLPLSPLSQVKVGVRKNRKGFAAFSLQSTEKNHLIDDDHSSYT